VVFSDFASPWGGLVHMHLEKLVRAENQERQSARVHRTTDCGMTGEGTRRFMHDPEGMESDGNARQSATRSRRAKRDVFGEAIEADPYI